MHMGRWDGVLIPSDSSCRTQMIFGQMVAYEAPWFAPSKAGVIFI